jgi:hypothetical protein
MSKGFVTGATVADRVNGEVYYVLVSDMLNTTVVTIDGEVTDTIDTDDLESFTLPSAI